MGKNEAKDDNNPLEPSDLNCEICKKIFKEKRNKRDHIIYTHQKSELTELFCEYCSKIFTRKKKLNFHIKTNHEMPRNFSCRFCEKTFGELCEKTRHERKHT